MNGVRKYTGTTELLRIAQMKKSPVGDRALLFPAGPVCYQGMMMSNSCEP